MKKIYSQKNLKTSEYIALEETMDVEHTPLNEDTVNKRRGGETVDDKSRRGEITDAADAGECPKYYWVKRSLEDAQIPSYLKASFISSIITRFFEIVQESIRGWVSREGRRGVVLFGGIHRRNIRSRHCLMREMTERKATHEPFEEPFSSSCFVSARGDLDYKLPSKLCVDELVVFLKTVFKTRVVRSHCDEYNQAGCLVTRLHLSPRLDIYDSKVGVGVDLITMHDSTGVFLPDFLSNTLQTTLDVSVGMRHPPLHLSPVLSTFFPSAFLSPYAEIALVSKVVTGIQALKTEMLVFSFKRYARIMGHRGKMCDVGATLRAEYDAYITTLFTYRLVKMVKEGWEITNLAFRTVNRRLVMPCGHIWESVEGAFEVSSFPFFGVSMPADEVSMAADEVSMPADEVSCIVTQCRGCQVHHIIFKDPL